MPGQKKNMKRRIEIVELLSYGFRAKYIGEKIGVNTRTVEMYVRRMLTENGCDNTTHLVATCLRKEIIK